MLQWLIKHYSDIVANQNIFERFLWRTVFVWYSKIQIGLICVLIWFRGRSWRWVWFLIWRGVWLLRTWLWCRWRVWFVRSWRRCWRFHSWCWSSLRRRLWWRSTIFVIFEHVSMPSLASLYSGVLFCPLFSSFKQNDFKDAIFDWHSSSVSLPVTFVGGP